MTRPIRILLAEDSRFAARAFRRQLRTWDRDFELTVATDGETACAMLEGHAQSFDIAVLDVNLPRRSGIEVLARVRNSDMLANLPCIILSTSDSPLDKVECERLDASDYLLKGSETDAILASLERNLSKVSRQS